MSSEDRTGFQSEPVPADILPAASVVDPALRETLSYWERLRGPLPMPARAQIVPKDIRGVLRYIHIYDVVEGGADFRARLVGTSVYPGLDTDQTGRLVSQHPDPGIRLRFGALLRHVYRTAAPARSVSRRITGDLMRDMLTEGLWLPLGEGGVVQQVMAQSSLRRASPGAA